MSAVLATLIESNTLIITYAGGEEHGKVLMQQILIGLIAKTETLQELMSQTHHLVHTHVTLLTATATAIINTS